MSRCALVLAFSLTLLLPSSVAASDGPLQPEPLSTPDVPPAQDPLPRENPVYSLPPVIVSCPPVDLGPLDEPACAVQESVESAANVPTILVLEIENAAWATSLEARDAGFAAANQGISTANAVKNQATGTANAEQVVVVDTANAIIRVLQPLPPDLPIGQLIQDLYAVVLAAQGVVHADCDVLAGPVICSMVPIVPLPVLP